jgi:hypothetical protein
MSKIVFAGIVSDEVDESAPIPFSFIAFRSATESETCTLTDGTEVMTVLDSSVCCPDAEALLESCSVILVTSRLVAFIVSLKLSSSSSVFMSRSNVTNVGATVSNVSVAASVELATTGFPAVSFTKPDVMLKNVLFVAVAMSVAAVRLFTSAATSSSVIFNPSVDTDLTPPVNGTDDPVLPL